MRILHLGALYPPRGFGGAERSVAALSEAQVRAGHEVTAVSLTPDGVVEKEERNGVRVFRVPHESLYSSEDAANHGALAFHWRKFVTPFNRRQRGHVERVLDLVRPDIVNTHSLVDVSTSIWPAVKRRGIPLVHTLRDYDLLCADGGLYHDGQPCGVRCQVMTAPKKRHQRAIDGVVAISDHILNTHLSAGLFDHIPDTRRHVIWNSARVLGLTPEEARRGREGQPFTFGFLGRLTEEKGVGMLIEAARELEQLDWRMLIAGQASQPNLFAAAVASLSIQLAGHIDPSDFFKRIDVLIVPSLWPEPFGRIVVEAYSVGVPVLASRVGGLPSLIVGDREDWTFPAGSVASLAKRMDAILAAGRSALPPPSAFDEILDRTEPAAVERHYHQLYDTLLREKVAG